jgi:hypothetical protein
MHRLTALIRRHGFTLVLTGGMVGLFVGELMPAVRERGYLRLRRQAAEHALARQQLDLRRGLLWLQGATDDPYVRERFQDAFRQSPDVLGPRVLLASPTAEDGDAAWEPSDRPQR